MRDSSTRFVRGMTLAGIEGLRVFGDSLAAFADGVFSRNEPRRNDSVRDLTTRLPGDLMGGFADAIDRLADIPARAADTYSSSWREGEDRDWYRERDDDRDRDRNDDRDSEGDRERDRAARARERGEGDTDRDESLSTSEVEHQDPDPERATRARARARTRDREREEDKTI